MSTRTVLGQIHGHDITVADLIDRLSTMDEDTVLGDLNGETITVGEALARLHRTATLPDPVPVEDRIPDDEWAEAVIVRGEAPYGRCPFCRTPKGVAGCLNMCEYPAAFVQEFQNGLHEVLNKRRSEIHFIEALGGCTCGPANLHGYATERGYHDYTCPMNPANRHD